MLEQSLHWRDLDAPACRHARNPCWTRMRPATHIQSAVGLHGGGLSRYRLARTKEMSSSGVHNRRYTQAGRQVEHRHHDGLGLQGDRKSSPIWPSRDRVQTSRARPRQVMRRACCGLKGKGRKGRRDARRGAVMAWPRWECKSPQTELQQLVGEACRTRREIRRSSLSEITPDRLCLDSGAVSTRSMSVSRRIEAPAGWAARAWPWNLPRLH